MNQISHSVRSDSCNINSKHVAHAMVGFAIPLLTWDGVNRVTQDAPISTVGVSGPITATKNQAFVFVKPHAMTPQAIELAKSKLAAAGITCGPPQSGPAAACAALYGGGPFFLNRNLNADRVFLYAQW